MKVLINSAKMATLAFAIGMSVMPASAFALPQYDRVVIYWNNGQVVGQYVKNCTGASSSWGATTSDFSVTEELCAESTGDPCAGWVGAPQGYACPWS